MGFSDILKGVGDYVTTEAVKKCEAMFERMTDEKLLEWYDEHRFDSDTDSRVIEKAEKELRRRHLNY